MQSSMFKAGLRMLVIAVLNHSGVGYFSNQLFTFFSYRQDQGSHTG